MIHVDDEPAIATRFAIVTGHKTPNGKPHIVSSGGVTTDPARAKLFKTEAGAARWIGERPAFVGDVVPVFCVVGTTNAKERRPFQPGFKLGTKRDSDGNVVTKDVVVAAFLTEKELEAEVERRKAFRAEMRKSK